MTDINITRAGEHHVAECRDCLAIKANASEGFVRDWITRHECEEKR